MPRRSDDAPRGREKKTIGILYGVWRALRPLCVFAASLCIVAGVAYTAYRFAYTRFIQPVDTGVLTEGDPSYRVVTIKSGSSVKTIARQLEEDGIIRKSAVFQYTVEFLSKGSKLQAGDFLLSPKMTIMELVDTLTSAQASRQTMRFTLVEGLTVERMAASLVEQGALDSVEDFLEICRTGEGLAEDYPFVAAAMEAPSAADRQYLLEGYLFPDTYEIYVGSGAETVVRKLLDRTREIINLTGVSYAIESGQTAMSVDEILNLASIIEKEALSADFEKVSAVFNLRLQKGIALQSDATIKYVTGSNRIITSSSEMSMDSGYNTYLYLGLPTGPICNPGRAAITAALYPDADYMKESYLYFCLGDPETGKLVFAKTYAEHEANVAKYQQLWIDYDAAAAAKKEQ